jgi:hypothetical protein
LVAWMRSWRVGQACKKERKKESFKEKQKDKEMIMEKQMILPRGRVNTHMEGEDIYLMYRIRGG